MKFCSTKMKCNVEQRRFLEKRFADMGFDSDVDVAQACGISKSYFSKLMGGKRSLGTKDRPGGLSKLAVGLRQVKDGKCTHREEVHWNEFLAKFGISKVGREWMEDDVEQSIAKLETTKNVRDKLSEVDAWVKSLLTLDEQRKRLLEQDVVKNYPSLIIERLQQHLTDDPFMI